MKKSRSILFFKRKYWIMKEIKFRGKILNGDRKGEWVHGYYFENFIGQHCIVTTCDDKDIDVVDWITKHIYKVDPTTVGQYVGVKDKNGKEIYEGDIYRFNRISRYCPDGQIIEREVEWDETLELDNSFGDIACGFHLPPTTAEIVGNIHNNPNLLTQ